MSNIFNINFSGLTTQLTPPILRNSKMLAWFKALSQPLQINNGLFNDYISGSTYSAYSSSITYSATNRVIASDRAVYEALSGNTGISPITGTTYWINVNDDAIGAEERSKYNAQIIDLEWALNRLYQQTTLPTNPLYWSGANHTNQIYIENILIQTPSFLLGNSGGVSSYISNSSANASSWIPNHFSGLSQTEFLVNVPLAIWTGTTVPIIRSYVDRYNLAGISYSATSY